MIESFKYKGLIDTAAWIVDTYIEYMSDDGKEREKRREQTEGKGVVYKNSEQRNKHIKYESHHN